MKRKLTITLAVVIIVIVIIAGAGIVFLGQRSDNITFEIGYYLDYQFSSNEYRGYNQSFDILAVNSSNVFYKEIVDQFNTTSTIFYNTSNDLTFFPYNPYNSSENCKNLGKETLDTKRGAISTDHYSTSWGFWNSGDCWTCNGILVKSNETQRFGITTTLVLVDTNMPQFEGQNASIETETR